MKKFIHLFVLASFLFSHGAWAFYYDAKCLTPQGKMKKCTLDLSQTDSVVVRYKDMAYQSLNREIRGKSIQHISVGEKAQFRIGATVGTVLALGPIGALMLLWKKKLDLYGIEFQNSEKHNEAILVGVKKKESFMIADKLKSISGKTVDFAGASVRR